MSDGQDSNLAAIDPQYVAARRVLLNALEALAPHLDSVIVAGAQAIYLRAGDTDLSATVAPFTTDGDLALDPTDLGDEPEIESAMHEAGFELQLQESGHVEPGIWLTTTTVEGQPHTVPVDLIVPEGIAVNEGRRGARLGAHGNRAARRAVGLEAALVDHGRIAISSLEAGDDRTVTASVAGVAALFVAKLHKLHDRVVAAREDRLDDKDAADVIRLMRAESYTTVAATMVQLAADERSGEVTRAALGYLNELFGRPGAAGIRMASDALRLALPAPEVEAFAIAYSAAMLRSANDHQETP